MASAAFDLKQLESLKYDFGPQAAKQKEACLQVLKSTRVKTSDQITRLHEILCFIQAWPDDAAILSLADSMLASFDQRRDLKTHAAELRNTGIAGTSIHFSFYAVTALWLANRWPDEVHVSWEDFENTATLERYLHLLASYSETPALESVAMELPDWISRLKGPDETDAIFVIRRLAVLVSNEFLHEHLYDELDIPLVLAPGPGVPNRTRAKCDDSPLVYQTSPLTRRRPVVGEETRRPLIPPKLVSRAAGIGLVDLARAAMVTRQRDLDASKPTSSRHCQVNENSAGRRPR